MLLHVLVVFLVVALVQCQNTIMSVLQNANLSPKCSQQFQYFFQDFELNPQSWALQMLDATSKLPSGLLSYNFGDMGNFEQCINIRASTNTSEDILGKYCLGTMSFPNNSLVLPAKSSIVPTWALCLPNQCSIQDASTITNTLISSLQLSNLLTIDFSELLCQTIKEVHPELSTGAVITITILAALFMVVLLGTFLDIYKTESCPLLLRGFSLYTNSTKIFKMTSSRADQMPCLDGLRFLSMMWVVAGHQFSIPLSGSLTNGKDVLEWVDNLRSMFIASGTLSVDTFFTIGGTLMAYGFMKAQQRKVPFNLLLYYLHRYLRLSAPLALVVLVSSTLIGYMGSGPKWPYLVLYFEKNCQDYWWSALLYVQNYVNVSKMCVGQTWYLDIDMQLYLVSPLIFFALWKYPKACIPFLVLCTISFMAVSFYEAWTYELPALLTNLYSTHSDDYSNKYYLLTHTRSTPWIIGILLGYNLYQLKQNNISLTLNRHTIVLCWAVSLATILTCVLGGHSTLRGAQYDQWGNALYIALVRPAWSIAIAWIIWACTNGHGGPINWLLSLPIFQVFNRFTYGIYLTHVTLLYVIMYGRQWPDYFSDFNMAYQFWGTLWFSTGLAMVLVFMTESPVIVIEKVLLGRFVRKVPKSDAEKGVDNPSFVREL